MVKLGRAHYYNDSEQYNTLTTKDDDKNDSDDQFVLSSFLDSQLSQTSSEINKSIAEEYESWTSN